MDLLQKIRGAAGRVRHAMVREIDFRRAKKNQLASRTLSREEKAWVEKVSLKIHPKDGMYDKSIRGGAHVLEASAAQHYLSVGLSASRCIDEALGHSRKNRAVRSILDFPCGYGRVLRFLKVRFPNAEIVACEIDPMALKFCKRVFSVKTIMSNENFSKLSLPRKFDLIWSGSLVTHLDEKRTSELLRFFYEHLAPGGLCLFTTHGRTSVQWIEEKVETYGLSASAQQKLLSEFHEREYGYANYEYTDDYGISVVSHDRMVEVARSIGEWTESVVFERGWDNHQDVYGFTKVELGDAACLRGSSPPQAVELFSPSKQPG
jgi:SAM-dependent methyltransferase